MKFYHKNLNLMGFQSHNTVLKILKKTSIAVACSRWNEPLGRTSLEASSNGCAVIISNRGGLPETITNGIILKQLDESELFKEIEFLIKNNTIRKKYQKLSDSKGAKIGSSSRRRELQLKLFDKNVKVASIRGNIDTRIKKIESGEYDGAVLALAGLKMLSLEKYAKEIFPIKDFIPTAGQGIIAVQCREEDETIRKILRKINHTETEICALTERSFLKTLGGDCNTAVGCSAILKKENIQLNAQLFSDDGKKVFNVVKLGKLNEPQLLGKLAGEEILKKSGNSFVKKR